jgi:hypothetical protein
MAHVPAGHFVLFRAGAAMVSASMVVASANLKRLIFILCFSGRPGKTPILRSVFRKVPAARKSAANGMKLGRRAGRDG